MVALTIRACLKVIRCGRTCSIAWRRRGDSIAIIIASRQEDPVSRTKRLAIMDSDGANYEFLTNGQASALTTDASGRLKWSGLLAEHQGQYSVQITR